MMRVQNIYRFTAQDVGTASSGGQRTVLQYEMAHFFVDEVVSSANAISVYTLIFLIVLFAMRSVIATTFIAVAFPPFQEGTTEEEMEEETVTVRMLATPVVGIHAVPNEVGRRTITACRTPIDMHRYSH